MTKLIALLILVLAAPLHAAVTHVRVRCDNGSVNIAGAPRDTVAARNARAAGTVVDVTASDGETIAVPLGAAVDWLSSGRAAANVRDVAALHIDASAGQITADRIAGNIDGKTANANVIARDVGGSVVLATGNGNVDLRRVRGLVEVTSGNGITNIAETGSGVHMTSISGKTVISCVAGAVGVQDTSGLTDVSSVAGDVDIFTALGAAHYDGALQPNRSYRLRTLDGAIMLSYSPASSGFSAQLASDVMHIFVDQKPFPRQRRLLLHIGDERARVVLDGVGGHVELRKRAAMPACR